MADKIHLGIAFDQNYIKHFYALFTSILHNNRGNDIEVHAIITGLTQAERDDIKKYATGNNASINFYEIDEGFVKRFVLTSKWSSAVYYRLFFPLLVPPGVEKLLYLDTDIIVVNDLAELYSTNLGNYPVGAVYDNWVRIAPQLGIHHEEEYFNSGVLLINVPVWREQKISEQAFDYLDKYPDRIFFVDQDALNAVLLNNWKKLEFRFNMLHSRIPEGMTRREKAEFLKDKVIIHYTLDRPWKMLCRNPYRNLYHHYLQQSPFKIKDKYDDHSFKKLPQWLKIKIVELYFNLPLIKSAWRRLKSKIA